MIVKHPLTKKQYFQHYLVKLLSISTLTNQIPVIQLLYYFYIKNDTMEKWGKFFEHSMLFFGGHCPAKLSYLISLIPPKTIAYFSDSSATMWALDHRPERPLQSLHKYIVEYNIWIMIYGGIHGRLDQESYKKKVFWVLRRRKSEDD